MDVLDPVTLVAGLCRVEIGSAAQSEIVAALEGIRRVRARVDASEVALARRLRELTPLAERDVSGAAQRSSRHGAKVADRDETVAAIPGLGELFESGDVSGEHVDAVSKAVRAAPVEVRDGLRAAVSDIVGDVVGSGLTPDELAVRLADETKRLEADDGVARLERQRGATRLRTWTDKHNGMFRISGQFDPFSGLAIHGRLQAAMAAMFAGGLPDMAPEDPGERQDFLRALALLALTAGVKQKTAPARATNKTTRRHGDPVDPGAVDTAGDLGEVLQGPRHRDPYIGDSDPDNPGDAGFGEANPRETDPNGSGGPGGSAAEDDPNLAWAPFANSGPPRFGRAEVIVVVDFTTLDKRGRPTIDWGGPVSLPYQCVEDLMQNALIHKVEVNNGTVHDPDGELDLDRTTRLANRAQRRALQAMYATCAVPGCRVRFEFTQPHHINYWRNGGKTDLINLIPLCATHHGCIHSGWTIELGPNRELTITLPDGQTMTTGPPKRATG
jgi:hypothetical protein